MNNRRMVCHRLPEAFMVSCRGKILSRIRFHAVLIFVLERRTMERRTMYFVRPDAKLVVIGQKVLRPFQLSNYPIMLFNILIDPVL
jgi:hypothetical protein